MATLPDGTQGGASSTPGPGQGLASSTPAPGGPAAPTGKLSTRGDLAYALYNALGIAQPTSTGQFGDAGYLDAVTSTLADLGITMGVGGGQFGTMQGTTRGEAFTMIARALGLADGNTDIPTASQALVNAGIVKGYANGDLGLNDQLNDVDLAALMTRVGPELDRPDATTGVSRRDTLNILGDEARDEAQSETDPAFAAFLREQGIQSSQVQDEIDLRKGLFAEDQLRRSETYQRATDRAMQGVGTDFENRGLYRSGTRVGRQADTRRQIGFQQEAESYQAQRQQEQGLRALEAEKAGYDRALTQARESSHTSDAESAVSDKYGQ